MWQLRSPVLVPFVLGAVALRVQGNQAEAKATSPAVETNGSAIVSLLEQSHELDQQFPLFLRLMLLERQASVALEVGSAESRNISRQWADELFALSFQIKRTQRSPVQSSAMRILARLDPNHALELLESAQLEGSGIPSPKMELTRHVFNIIVEHEGIDALPMLEAEAAQMGTRGPYPYAALGHAAVQAVAKDWVSNRQHAVEVIEGVFEQAFARYSQGSQDYPSNCDFGEMLRGIAGALPFEVVKPAVHLLVKNLLATDISKYQFQAQAFTQDGGDIAADNAIDAALLWFASLLSRDPELVEELESARPELQTVLEAAKAGGIRGGSFGPATARRTPRVSDPDEERREAALRLSHTNPDLAVSKVEQLTDDDQRARTALQVAGDIAGTHTEQAAQLIAQTQKASQTGEGEAQLDLISAQASMAAAQNEQQQLSKLLQRGFELAKQIISEPQRPDQMQRVSGLAALVQIGAQNYPDLTTVYLQSLPPSRLKAELFLAAAEALQLPRLPFGSPTPK